MLAWSIYISFLGALAAYCAGRDRPGLARGIALAAALLSLAAAWIGSAQFEDPGAVNVIARVPWIPALGITYFLAADGISCTLVVLTGIAAIAGILFSWNVRHRANEFFALYLALISGVFGVFREAHRDRGGDHRHVPGRRASRGSERIGNA